MLHRDVSVNNVMFQFVDGRLDFKLIDFDNAKQEVDADGNHIGQTSKHRTGTLPFMAFELNMDAFMAQPLNQKNRVPVKHVLRHDFASVYLLSLWCGEVLPVKNVPQDDLLALIERAKSLEKGGLEEIAIHKERLCEKGLKACHVFLPDAAEGLYPWFSAWNDIFSDAAYALRTFNRAKEKFEARKGRQQGLERPTWDDETCNNTFTYKKLTDALRIEMERGAKRASRKNIDDLTVGRELARLVHLRRFDIGESAKPLRERGGVHRIAYLQAGTRAGPYRTRRQSLQHSVRGGDQERLAALTQSPQHGSTTSQHFARRRDVLVRQSVPSRQNKNARVVIEFVDDARKALRASLAVGQENKTCRRIAPPANDRQSK